MPTTQAHATYTISLDVADEAPIVRDATSVQPAKLNIRYREEGTNPSTVYVRVHGIETSGTTVRPGGTLDLTHTPADQRPAWVNTAIDDHFPQDWPR